MIERTSAASEWEGRARLAVLAIAAITAVTGALQVVAPGAVLDLLSADRSPPAEQGFATVGMFMVLFAGLVLHALTVGSGERVALLWASLQKLGASAAVGVGVARGVFSGVALLVASFDLASGALMLWYRGRTGGGS
jgi:hypothetical protein